jgi:phage terminase Nu1 subunit (DNA packaging protein)
MATIVKANELATIFGVTTRTISDWVKRGVIRKLAKGFDRDDATRRLVKHLLTELKRRGIDKPTNSAQVERGNYYRIQAAIAQQKLDIQSEKLVDGDEMFRRFGEELRIQRTYFLGFASRMAQKLPHLSAHDIATIDKEMRDFLNEFVDEAHKRLKNRKDGDSK